MNEVRLYWWDRAPQAYLRFVIKAPGPLLPDLLKDDEDARFDRFLFAQVFRRERLLSRGGRPTLLRLVERQGGREKTLEGEFYQDYKGVRDRLFDLLRTQNPDYAQRPGRLLRLTQKILDRFIFAFYCEDMGQRMLFPPQLIRDTLKARSLEPLFESDDDELWRYFSRLFRRMDEGGRLGQVDIRAFNGGLFRHDPEIDALHVPNRIFCEAGQGANPASIARHPFTLLHLCADYNYAARGEARESISLYTLGRIFEQSITELEKKEAELEGRRSLADLAKRKLPTRKAQGVYYTPEWVVDEIVRGTLEPWFAQARAAAGWREPDPPTAEQLDAYEAAVAAMRIVDPACGSGAFLIGAFRRLLAERLEIARFRRTLTGAAGEPDEAALTAAILDRNLYGVDISGPAVEIAKLALWLHSARADAPLSSLDGAVKCGNSLVGPDYYRWTQIAEFTESAREQVNAFDWAASFPFGGEDPSGEDPGRFDIVLGNPPYVKLQNLKQASPDVADYLLAAREGEFYRSTQTGNFDLYLPFIEKGLRLLRPGGRMGYIAPSLWAVNEYGEALRQLVRAERSLARWVDFKSHQIFAEAMTYTALQFFSATPNAAVEVTPAPGGEADVADARGDGADRALDYARLADGAPWLLATGEERALIDRLAESCLRLDDRSLTTHIFQGLITSADSIYHLQRLGTGRYRCTPEEGEPYEVEIEDALMKPLVSGPEAKRYEEPVTDTYLLFPYERDAAGRMGLIRAAAMERRFLKGWAFLKSWEAELRARENRGFDDAEWFRFGRNQNIDKQDRTKLIVPRLVRSLKSSLDFVGEFYLDNVDVGGVLAVRPGTAIFLNAVLNGPMANFVFRRISKPFANDYRSANRQFIAPLPVPKLDATSQAEIARAGRNLQRLWTKRRDLLAAIAERLAVLHRQEQPEGWLWPDLPSVEAREAQAPARLKGRSEKRAWAKAKAEEALAERRAALQALLDHGGPPEAGFADGRLSLTFGGTTAASLYVDEAPGPLVQAYWRWLFLSGPTTDAERLSTALRRAPLNAELPAARQFIDKVNELAVVAAGLAEAETAMDERLFDLYGLTREERELVRRG